jgi:lauroyl/myristoyl acyltransferase
MSGAFRVFHFASYIAFRLGEALIRLLSLDCAFVLGRAGGELAHRILRDRRAVALANLRLAFGREMSEAQLRALNREHFQLLGANLLAGLKASTLPHEKIWERVTANVPDERGQTGWIALISHIGNWELYGHLGEKFPEYRFGALYQPLANPFIDRYLQAARTRSGIALFDRRKELLSCVRFLREGGVVGVLVDQGAGYAGLWTPLFGRLTSSSTLAARLSVRTRLPIVPFAITTSGRARWQMTVSDPIYSNGDEAEVLTAKLNRVLEEQIRRSPADWLWAHNRWKPLRPHFLFARDQRRVFLPANFDRSTLDPFRILIVSPISAAEAVATFPAVHAIKQGRPDNSITVLALDALANVWKNNSTVDRVLAWKKGESVFSLAARIRTLSRFDVSIFFATSWKMSLAIWLAGIPLRVGRRSGINSWLCNQHPIEPDSPFDCVRMNLHIAQSVGADINAVPL